jgi:hypothetical protein
MNKIYKFIFLLIFSILFVSNIIAKEADGYVITNQGDTIKGKITLPVDLIFFKSSFNTFHPYFEVYFKSYDKSFHHYNADEIIEYGYFYKGNKFRFISKEHRNVFSQNITKYFYLQITTGYINIFKYKSEVDSENPNTDNIQYVDYYILDVNNNLINIKTIDSNETVVDFLVRITHADKAILTKAAEGYSYKDIIEIANKYNEVVSRE